MPDIAMSKAISASNRLYDIPSLENDGSNFQTWKYRISTVLDVRGLVNLVDGTEVVPILPDGTKEADAAIIREKILDWQRHDKEARAQLTLTLKDEPLSGVIHAISAADVWDKLLRRYKGKGKQTVAFLTGKIFRGTFYRRYSPRATADRCPAQGVHPKNAEPRALGCSCCHRSHHFSARILLDSPYHPYDHT